MEDLKEHGMTVTQQRMTLTTFTQHCSGGPSQCDNARE